MTQLNALQLAFAKYADNHTDDLAVEVLNRLQAVARRDARIRVIMAELPNNSWAQFDEASGEFLLFGEPSGIRVSGGKVVQSGAGWAKSWQAGQNDLTRELEDLTTANYEDMHRIYTVCRKLPGLSPFQPRGTIVTRNKLLTHSGAQDSTVTFDSFAYKSPGGPVVKGLRKGDQADSWRGAGHYEQDLIDFIGDLRRVLSAAP
jgi:hypothetical protein